MTSVPALSAIVSSLDGVTVKVRLRPGGSRNAILGRNLLANGEWVVLAAVSPPPEGGKANAALIQLLAKSWGLRKSAVTIVAGMTARNKTLHVEGPPEALMAQLAPWFDQLPAV